MGGRSKNEQDTDRDCCKAIKFKGKNKMATFIFCLIFLQVTIFLAAGAVLFTTFYAGIRSRAERREWTPSGLSSTGLELSADTGT